MVHVPSFSVFKNWPLDVAGLKVVTAMDFSPNAGYFSVGNKVGEALLYRLLANPTY
jgi:U3 small nucleolar RNA-associated protein 18